MSIKCDALPPVVPGFAWVYVMALGEAKAISKIGVSVNVGRRLARFTRAGLDYPITFEGAWRLSHASLRDSMALRVESHAHALLFGRRLYGLNDQFLVAPDQAECAIYEAIRKVMGTKFEMVRFP